MTTIARNQPASWNRAWMPYAAQEADIMLSAIAQSNGTRASVTKHLFHARITDGPLGSFDITPTGDPSRGIVLAYRLVGRSPGTHPFAVFRIPASDG